MHEGRRLSGQQPPRDPILARSPPGRTTGGTTGQTSGRRTLENGLAPTTGVSLEQPPHHSRLIRFTTEREWGGDESTQERTEQLQAQVDSIRNEGALTRSERESALRELAMRYLRAIGTVRNDASYEELKTEAKFLAGLSQVAFAHMAQRLLAIRAQELYRAEGYEDFSSFIEAELPLSRSTVYNYMDIVEHFGVQPVGCDDEFEYSKLLPALPLLRAENRRVPKEQIRASFLRMAKELTKQDIVERAKVLRARYGLVRGNGRAAGAELGSILQRLLRYRVLDGSVADVDCLYRIRDVVEKMLGEISRDGGVEEREPRARKGRSSPGGP